MIISKGTRNRQINRRQMLKAAVAIAGGMVVLSDPKRGGAQPASGPPPEQQLQGQDLEDALLSPVESDHVDALEPKLEAGIALCLSGGGYRAMLFHVGVLWRLNELGYLPKLDRISSVSGGSITSGVLGLSWSYLDFDVKGVGPVASATGPFMFPPAISYRPISRPLL